MSGYTALQAGISLLPLTAVMFVLSARSGALAARIGPRLQMSVGPVLVGLGLALFTRVGAGGNYLTVLGLGLAATVAPLTATVLAAVPARHAGMASAVNIAGGFCVLAGSLAAVTIRNPRPDGAAKTKPTLHCGLDAPPVHVSTTPSAA